jgi:DNA invertase Pin-like site-specific DNA recombinase
MAAQKEHKVGIYVRLSKEDARAGESVSIENQKLLLTKHVKDQGWELVEIYCDDGFSGTNQNRPALQRMFKDIRQGHINVVLIKDLSRLGRNYLEVGNLAEVFLPEHGCELISLNEKVDEMMVFRNWFNEQHSRDTSKKVKAVKKMCAQDGKFIGAFAPYGYKKAEDNKHRLVPDEPAAMVVRKIFELRSQGMGHQAISRWLNDAGYTPPRDYYYQDREDENPFRITHSWGIVTVRNILRNEAYIGNTVSFKHGTVSYKSHKMKRKPEDEWVRVENTHEPIISMDLWEQAQDITVRRYHPHQKKDGSVSIFCGLLYCADCGFKMRSATQKKTRKNGNLYVHTNFMCGTYSRCGKTACTTHTVTEDALYQLVAEDIREQARKVDCDEQLIVGEIVRFQNSENITSRAACENELKSHRSRLAMLDKLIDKLCEDRVTGAVPETAFRNLIQKYEKERLERRETAQNLENRIQSIRLNEDGAHKWARLIKQYTQLESLDAQVLLKLIDRIEVGEERDADGTSKRSIRILYRYVGDLSRVATPAGGVDPEETEAAYGQAV